MIKTRELKRRYELDGPRQTIAHLTEALEQGHLRPEDFNLRDLAEGLVPDGHEWVRLMDPRSAVRADAAGVRASEERNVRLESRSGHRGRRPESRELPIHRRPIEPSAASENSSSKSRWL